MDINDNKGRYRISEMIMINPFNNWSFSFVGVVWKTQLKDKQTSYYGVVKFDNDIFCCRCKNKDDVVPALEFLFSLKYHHSEFRHRYRLFKTLYAEANMN